jgi:hypothetical protein
MRCDTMIDVISVQHRLKYNIPRFTTKRKKLKAQRSSRRNGEVKDRTTTQRTAHFARRKGSSRGHGQRQRVSDNVIQRSLADAAMKSARTTRRRVSTTVKTEWIRPYWLWRRSLSRFVCCGSRRSLGSILGILVGGNLEKHQPPAKLFSVCTTLVGFFSSTSRMNEDAATAEKERSRGSCGWSVVYKPCRPYRH